MSEIAKIFQEIALSEYKKINNGVSFFKDIPYSAKDSSNNAILCPDQYVATIKIKRCFCYRSVAWEECYLDKNKRNTDEQKALEEKSLPTIAIVLESPHTDEFDRDNKCAIGPACGTTGQNLKQWLPEVLLNYVPHSVDQDSYKATINCIKRIPCGTYRLLLVNAIQYQCSLGELGDDTNKKKRDTVFKEMWEKEEVKKDFIARINSHNPKIIINCCTKGETKEYELRKLVAEVMKYNCKESLLLRAAHPSSYHFKNGLSELE